MTAHLRGVVTGAVTCAAAALTVLCATAVAVAVSGLADEARRQLGFGFEGIAHTPGQALAIALHNTLFTLGILVAAAGHRHLPARVQALVDVLLGGLLALNAATVGVALGAYGPRVAAAIAAHLPLEFAAMSIAGGAYLHARMHPLAAGVLARIAAACVVLVLAAAVLETYDPFGGLS